MIESYVAKLDALRRLSKDSKTLLRTMPLDVRRIGTRTDILRKGDKSEVDFIVIEGWVCQYNMVRDGSRQITGFLLPGDAWFQESSLIRSMDHNIGTLSDTKLGFIDRSTVKTLFAHPDLGEALMLSRLAELSILRTSIMNLGRKDALARASHLLCELHARLSVVGFVHDNSFLLPLTQEEISDAIGITSVHLNRVLKQMREMKLIAFVQQKIEIVNLTGLQRLAEFDPEYLKIGISQA